MDLTQTRYLDYPNLTRYCHLVAGVVGEVSARIFGQTDAATTAYAHKLGQAFQLTNIIRDVGEDGRKGRIYLPANELQQFGVTAADIEKALNARASIKAADQLVRIEAGNCEQVLRQVLASPGPALCDVLLDPAQHLGAVRDPARRFDDDVIAMFEDAAEQARRRRGAAA